MSDPALPLNSVDTRHTIWRMYRDAADQDYLIARFSARSNLVYQFWWNAEQAIEKYLKAILLLNGYPVATYGHKLASMFEVAIDIAGDLLPILHCPPNCFVERTFPYTNPRGFKPVDEFVAAVEQNGNPNNRYRMFSTFTRSVDLVYFDELCFLLRRVAFPLDIQVDQNGTTARSELTVNRKLQLHPKMGFEDGLTRNHSDVWREHFEWCNFAYFYDESLKKGLSPRWGGAINAQPYLAIEQGTDQSLDGLRWIAMNALTKGLRNEVLKAIDESKRQ